MRLTFYGSCFQQVVREQCNVFDRALTQEDALSVRELYLCDFDFRREDIETLCLFSNLTSLCIDIIEPDASFWNHFPKLRELYWCTGGDKVDFSVFSQMHDLARLSVSGGDLSSMELVGLESLGQLRHLERLTLHEFGSVDLAPLGNMLQLKRLSVSYADSVKNIEAIGKLQQLEYLHLADLCVDNLDFLDLLPERMQLEMSEIRLCGREEADAQKWLRFRKSNVDEIHTAALK